LNTILTQLFPFQMLFSFGGWSHRLSSTHCTVGGGPSKIQAGLKVLSQTMFLKAIRGFISVSSRRELSTLLEFFNLVQHENQWRNSQFYYLRQNPFSLFSSFSHDAVIRRNLGGGRPESPKEQGRSRALGRHLGG